MKSAAVQFVKKDWGGSDAGAADGLDPLRPFPSRQETLSGVTSQTCEIVVFVCAFKTFVLTSE